MKTHLPTYLRSALFACLLGLAAVITPQIIAEEVAVGTNLLYWATTTPNVSADIRLSDRFSLSAAFGYNAFNFPNYTKSDGSAANPKLHHWLVMPEGRWWLRESFRGGYIGLHLFGGQYNVGGLRFPKFIRDHRYEGYAFGAGVGFGWQWRFARHWAVETSVGVGYAHLKYAKYRCGNCGRKERDRSRNYVGPTKASVSISYIIPSSQTKIVSMPEKEIVRDTVYRIVLPSTPEKCGCGCADTLCSGCGDAREATRYCAFCRGQKVEAEAVVDTARFVIGYPVDGSEFRPDFGKNRMELDSLDSLLKEILSVGGDGKELVTVSVVGYASPEHHFSYNLTLSERRARVIAGWIGGRYNLPVGVECEGRGEDWEGFLKTLKDSGISGWEEISRIASGNDGADERDAAILRSIGDARYHRLVNEIYPALRRTEIMIIYKKNPISPITPITPKKL